MLFKLFFAELLTQENFDCVLTHPNLKPIINSLSEFNPQNNLTQSIFEQLMRSQEKVSFHTCGTNFFPNHKRRHDSESYSKTLEYNRQICKN